MTQNSLSPQASPPESKGALALSTLFVLALAGVGIWMLSKGPDPSSVFIVFRNKTMFYTVAICVTVFFTAFGLFGLKRLLSAGRR